MSKKYNACLDFIKGIACICVVLMHCEFPGILGIAVQTVSRFYVPFFFMVSGFFAYKKPENGMLYASYDTAWHIKKIKHILKIILWACILYIPVAVITNTYRFTLGGAAKWLLFNQPIVITGQMWFLFALLYVYICYFIIDKLKLIKLSYIAMFLLFALYICLAQGMYLLGYSVENFIYRNWLVEGLPFFLLGHFLNKLKQKGKLEKLKNPFIIWGIVITTLLCLLERYLLGRDFGVNIMTFPQVALMFIFAVQNPDMGKGLLLTIGNRYSMFVYIIHPAIWKLGDYVYGMLGLTYNLPALYALPVLVLIITLGISALVYKIANAEAFKK